MGSLRHWHSEPDESTKRFVGGATFTQALEELNTVLEVNAYAGGTFRVVSATITPREGKREVVQQSALMFHDVDEAKHAIDLILDRLAEEARGL